MGGPAIRAAQRAAAIAVVVSLTVACEDAERASTDAGMRDVHVIDATDKDARVNDAALPDVGAADATEVDAAPDASLSPDADLADATALDASPSDAALLCDAGCSGGDLRQAAYIKPSNTAGYEGFGFSMAMDEDTLVIGAYGERSAATGVNGDQTDRSASSAGAVYVFARHGTTWSRQAYLKASNTDAGDQFGYRVALSGDTLAVGAFNEDSAAVGTDGDESDNSAQDSGAVYVFVRNGTTWSQQAYLKASNAEAEDNFGWSVALAGDTLVVGAPKEQSAAVGINGDQADNSRALSGASYVFVRNGTQWTQQGYLKASNSGADQFGFAVAIAADRVAVSAIAERSNATGINGDQDDNSVVAAGAVYLFTRTGSTWSQEAYVKASTPGSRQFGVGLALDDTRLVVGANNDRSAATGVNGDPSGTTLTGAGAAFVFTRNNGAWMQEAYLKASNTGLGFQLGFSVAIHGSRIIVGSPGERSLSSGVNGSQTNGAADDCGAAYLFAHDGDGWSQRAYLKASNPEADDRFGQSVAISSDTVVVGAYLEDGNAVGLNGAETSNAANNSGAAYLFAP